MHIFLATTFEKHLISESNNIVK